MSFLFFLLIHVFSLSIELFLSEHSVSRTTSDQSDSLCTLEQVTYNDVDELSQLVEHESSLFFTFLLVLLHLFF